MLNFYEYKLPFARPFKTAKAEFSSRRGIILQFKNQKFELLSEASPLPGFSKETVQQINKTLHQHRYTLDDFFQSGFSLADLKIFLHEIPRFPSLQFAISYLGLAILSKKNKRSISDLTGIQPAKELFINQTIGHTNEKSVLEQIDEAAQNGFQTIKIKADSTPKKLAATLAEASVKHPHIYFRIDANQSWPEEKVHEYSSLFSGINIQYIEEPTPVTTPEHLQTIQKKCALPVAVDESIETPQLLQAFLESGPDLVVVLKPMLLGNIFTLLETIGNNRSTHQNVVVTTALESKIGRTAVAVIASLVGDPATAHGLNTGQLFEHDLFPDFPSVKNGVIKDPEAEYHLCTLQNVEPSLIKHLE